MSIASSRDFIEGKQYKVIQDTHSSYYKKGMIVELDTDDGSATPLFKRISGKPKTKISDDLYYIDLDDLEPIENYKDKLIEYAQKHYPCDTTLKTLILTL